MRLNSPESVGLAFTAGVAAAFGAVSPASAYSMQPTLPSSPEIAAAIRFAASSSSDWNSEESITAVDTVQRFLSLKKMDDLSVGDQKYFLVTYAKAPVSVWEINCANYSPVTQPCTAIEKKLEYGWAALPNSAQRDVRNWVGEATLDTALTRLSLEAREAKIAAAKAAVKNGRTSGANGSPSPTGDGKQAATGVLTMGTLAADTVGEVAKSSSPNQANGDDGSPVSSGSMPIALGAILILIASATAAIAANPYLLYYPPE
ncbi:hypothetical protein ACFSSC_06650 [Corynebacterium mendelii]|uniref:Uncharacterized protein n=1 Tax=Corynebacterium mendelii TaxID=2765362 RepID=A0A939IXZ3_9CORY|nr:hypothetical protein [Corynebacterium mendelii]MBN9644990.1 hypothetical protein [Corynebacterium mendelii]